MTRVTEWFDPATTSPRYKGIYELCKATDGIVMRARFKGKHWYDPDTGSPLDVSLYRGWRGRDCRLSYEKCMEYMEYLRANYSRLHVRKLFRHFITTDDWDNAALVYGIGRKLGAKFSRAERDAYAELEFGEDPFSDFYINAAHQRFRTGHDLRASLNAA